MKTAQALLAAATLCVSALTFSPAAKAGDCCCPDCGKKVCRMRWEEVTEEKHCFKVACEDICIPGFHWPWQKCCEPRHARIRTVHVLKKVDYECKRCGCVWEVTCVGCDAPCDGKAPGADPDSGIEAPPPPPVEARWPPAMPVSARRPAPVENRAPAPAPPPLPDYRYDDVPFFRDY